jgi:sulfur-carrier protein
MVAIRVGSTVRLLLFGPARQAVGRSTVLRALPTPSGTLEELMDALGAEFPSLRPILRTSRVAVNGVYATERKLRLCAGDEVAIHPPFSGG